MKSSRSNDRSSSPQSYIKFTILILRGVVLLYSILSLIFLAFTISSLSKSGGLPLNTYFLQLDYADIKFNNVFNVPDGSNFDFGTFEKANQEVGMPRYLRIGFFGHAFVNENGDVGLYESSKPGLEYFPGTLRFNKYFAKYAAYLQDHSFMNSNINLLAAGTRVPPDLPTDHKMNGLFKASFGLLTSSLGLLSFAVIFFALSFVVSETVDLFGVGSWFIYIAYIVNVIGAAMITALGRRVTSDYKKNFDEFGIKASWGNQSFYAYIWISFAFMALIVLGLAFQYPIVNLILRCNNKGYSREDLKLNRGKSRFLFMNGPSYLETERRRVENWNDKERSDPENKH